MNNVSHIIKQMWLNSPSENWGKFVDKIGKNAKRYGDYDRHLWCLSTGRVGTQTISEIGALMEEVVAVHEPFPSLYPASKLSYMTEGDGDVELVVSALLSQYRNLKKSSNKKSVYLESSPQVTFLAPALLKLFPNSKFVHVMRHPADVVRSGMRRNWYGGHGYDAWRIVPRDAEGKERWRSYTRFEKNVWLWNETNEWIRNFCDSLTEDRTLVLNSEDIFDADEKTMQSLVRFIDPTAKVDDRKLARVMGKKLNSQKTGEFESYKDWDIKKIETLKGMAGRLMEQYGYS